MFTFTPLSEQFSAATKANFDAQLALLATFTSKAIESVEKVVELNLTAARTAIEESNETAKQLVSAKDLQEVLNLTTASIQPNTDKALAYARHLASITTSAQAEFTKTAEAHMAETNHKVIAFINEIAKNAPPGSENIIALLKSTIGNVSASYEQLNKAAKQAVEVLETNLTTAVNQISQAASKAAPRAANKKA
jgi:phasin family protein